MGAKTHTDIFTEHERDSAERALSAAREQWNVALALEDLSRRVSQLVREHDQPAPSSPTATPSSPSSPSDSTAADPPDPGEALLSLLGERQLLVERFVRLGERCMGRAVLDANGILCPADPVPPRATTDQRRQLAEHAQRIEDLVRRLMESDAADMRRLEARRDALAREMARLDSGRTVSSAYVAGDAAAPSLADREG